MTDNTPESLPRIMPIDTEHIGIRLVLPVAIVIGFITGYILSSLVISTTGSESELGCIPFIVAIASALLFAAIANVLLKRVWTSGRILSVDSEGILLKDKRRGKDNITRIQWGQHINPLTWRFKVSRGTAKGSMMLGLKLIQDDSDLTLYTFLPEKQAETLAIYERFTSLISPSKLNTDTLSLREKGEQKRLLAVERERWEDGAELRREDFKDLVAILMQHVSDWRSGGST